jgi:CheY-like chemotaxis protein
MPPGDPSRPGSSLAQPTGERPLAPADSDPMHDLAAALHEVSNALTVVLGWVDVAHRSKDARAVKAALDVVAARASHARDIARRAIGAGARPSVPSPVTAIADDAALGLSVEAKRAHVIIDVQVDPAARHLTVSAGPSLLQILTNLLLNAIAFSPRGSIVRLSVGAGSGDRVPLLVEDEGPGVPPEIRDRIFEGGVTSRRDGAGIGLRHSAALADQAGGELRLGHAARGTRFELLWPLAEDDGSARSSGAPESAERPATVRPSIDGARILIVEDDDAVIELLELALEARGASVVSVKARTDLPRVLESGRFDAALLDMSPLLGDVDGAVSELRRTNPHARLVVMSGSVPLSSVGGAATWVRKPFEVREIVDALGGAGAPKTRSDSFG